MSRLSVLGIPGSRASTIGRKPCQGAPRLTGQRLRRSSTSTPITSFRHQFTWPGIKMETSLGFKIQTEPAEEIFCLKKIAEKRTVSLSRVSL